MPDPFTVTTNASWGSRLVNSIKSVFFGFVLFVVAFPLLFWNEGRAVQTARSLEEGAGVVASVSADAVDPSNAGRLIHVNGTAKIEDILRDDKFGVSENAVRLTRSVEMYQWVENESSTSETKLGGSEETRTTYTYVQEWSSSRVDSASFQIVEGHQKPTAMPYQGRAEQAASVSLGAFDLSDAQIRRLTKSEPLRLESLPSGFEGARLHEGHVYVGKDPNHPAIGDARIRFSVVRPAAVSIVAQQAGSSFSPYQTEAGGTVSLLEQSIVSAEAMFQSAQRSNTYLTWGLRLVGFLVMFFGLALVFAPIAVFGDVVPIVGRLLAAGTGIFSALVAGFFSIGTIAIAWIAYRPLLGIVLGALAIGAVVMLVRIAGRHAKPVGPPPLPATQ